MNAILDKALATAVKNSPSAGASAPISAAQPDASGAADTQGVVFGEILGQSLQAMSSEPEASASAQPTPTADLAAEAPPLAPPSGPAFAALAPVPGDAAQPESEPDQADSPSVQISPPGFALPPVQLAPLPVSAPASGDAPAPQTDAVAADGLAPRPVAAQPLGTELIATPLAPGADLAELSALPTPSAPLELGGAAKVGAARRPVDLPASSGEDKVAIRASIETLDLPAPSALPAFADGQSARLSEPVLKLANGQSAQWQQPLTEALGERLSLLRESGRDSAVIRLDPPAMGQIEITIRHEAGALKVSLEATHSEVLRQLQGIGEALRQDLAQKQGSEVTVQVAQAPASYLSQRDSEGGERQRRQQQQSLPGQALVDADTDREALPFRLSGSGE